MGRKEMERAIYESLPSAKYCKENQMLWSLEDDEELPFLRNKIKQDYHYDTPMTVDHELKVLRSAGFSSVDIIKSREATFTLIAKKQVSFCLDLK